MFTGIIEEMGTVESRALTRGTARISIRGPLVAEGATRGASISVSGVCLTVVDHTHERVAADVMAHTLTMTTLADVEVGARVNLERAALVGGRLGGHFVQGHIDGTERVHAIVSEGASRVIRFSLARMLAPLVAGKGSIAIDGVSLTVSAVSAPHEDDAWFEVSLIPETLAATTLGLLRAGDHVNIETDVLARHVQRLLARDVHSLRDTSDTVTTNQDPA